MKHFFFILTLCGIIGSALGTETTPIGAGDLLDPQPARSRGWPFPRPDQCLGFDPSTESFHSMFAPPRQTADGPVSVIHTSEHIKTEAYGSEPLNAWGEAQLTWRAVNQTSTPVQVLFFHDSVVEELHGPFYKEARPGRPVHPLSGRFGPPADAEDMVNTPQDGWRHFMASGRLEQTFGYQGDYLWNYRWPVKRPFWVLLQGEGYCRLYQTKLPEWLQWGDMAKEREIGFYLGHLGTFAEQVAKPDIQPGQPLDWLGNPTKTIEADGWSGPTAIKVFCQGTKPVREKQWQVDTFTDPKEWDKHIRDIKEKRKIDPKVWDNPPWIKTIRTQVEMDPPLPAVLRLKDGQTQIARTGMYLGPPPIPGATGPIQLLVEPQWPILVGQDVPCTVMVGNISALPLWFWPNDLHPSQATFTLHRQPKPLPSPRILGAPVQLELGPKVATLTGEALAPLKLLQPERGPEYVMPGEFRSFRRTLPASFFEKLRPGEPFQIRAEIATPWLAATKEQATAREVVSDGVKPPEKPTPVFGASMVYKLTRGKKP